MSRENTKRIVAIITTALSAIAVSGCGKSSNASNNNGPGAYYGQVTPGYPGYPGTAAGCYPVTGQIPFIGYNVNLSTLSIISNPQSDIRVGGSVAQGNYNGSGSDGAISISVNPQGANSYYYNNPTTITGYLQLSPLYLQVLAGRLGLNTQNNPYNNPYGNQYPYNNPYNTPGYPAPTTSDLSQICVQDIESINLGVSYSGGYRLYGGRVTLRLNNNALLEVYF